MIISAGCASCTAQTRRRLRIGPSERDAAADAWVGTRSLGTLFDAVIDGKPLPLPDGRWTFELHPPGVWERTFAVHSTTTTSA
jgi:hypothetical protein